jgi:hypothetical protein
MYWSRRRIPPTRAPIAALERAHDAAGDLDIKIGGGVSTVR